MRKNYISLLFLLLSIVMFGQKVTLTPTGVNGAGYSAGPINLAGVPNSSISLGVKVEMPATSAPGDNGTLKIYYSKGTGLGANVAIGGDSGALYFGGGKVATKSFVINLNWTDFLTAGGFIYAEYKSGVSYNSSNVAVVKNATMTSGTTLNPPADAPNPSNIVNTLCCNQTIRQGDKPAPITGSQYLNPYNGLPYGVNSMWTNTSNGESPKLDDVNRILYFDYAPELKNITVNRKLGYSYGGQFPNKSNDVTITVVPSPIAQNAILIYANPNPDGFIEHININPIQVSVGLNKVNVDLDILDNPFHPYSRGDRFANVERFEWEYTKTSKAAAGFQHWITIPNENSPVLNYFNPTEISSTEDNYYLLRRIAIYKDIKNSSNILKVMVRTIGYNNTICCDQVVKILSSTNFETPDVITGSTPILDDTNITGTNFQINNISYQWQVQPTDVQTNQPTVWSDISGATTKDYLPAQLFTIKSSGRTGTVFIFDKSYKYRRITKINYRNLDTWISGTVSSYSNEVSLYGSTYEEDTKIYPNPTTSVLNIESRDISLNQIDIVNIMGERASIQITIVNPDLISLDVSNLITGTYFITMQRTSSSAIIQKAFIKH